VKTIIALTALAVMQTVRRYVVVHGNPFQSYRASPAIWDHSVLAAIQHRCTCP